MPEFIPPPEAPVFEPTKEEFKDPLAYIARIRPIAEKSGICKIRPPSDWRPPFSVNVPQFRFTPRVQRLNELEATTRVKLNFMDAVAKYWELQGTSMRLPTVEGAPLDLLKLWKVVEEEGGFHHATKEKRWTQIACKMGFTKYQVLGHIIRSHYEKILYPYFVFKNVQLSDAKEKPEAEVGEKATVNGDSPLKVKKEKPRNGGSASPGLGGDDADETWCPPPRSEEKRAHGNALPFSSATPDRPSFTVGEPTPSSGASTGGSSITTRRSRRMACGVGPVITLTHTEHAGQDKKNRELQRLQFLSPGPKFLEGIGEGPPSDDGQATDKVEPVPQGDKPLLTVTKPDGTLDVDSIVCYSCRHGDGEDCILLCDVCNASYHTYCLVPPLRGVPPGDWRCPPCVAKEVSKPQDPFGFEQADKVYTLHTFQTFANRFKGDYFGTAPHLVALCDVEQEFWRLVHSIEDDVSVEYGADLHSSDHGSGFPVGEYDDEPHQFYSQSGWNLNNLPTLDSSVLRHITADISGMKVPWLYVGMCFSSFCWHNEDHWSYSINYLHWGEPKTWYGVPGACAANFEKAMHSTVPELFQETPDLLHHLVTLISPNVLMGHGIPVVRTNQLAGEFVVTFPRAYHAGFNQGYNFAEAVNFCPADWIPHGRQCMTHYQQLHRYTVFAHNELVCKMAMQVDGLDVQMAAQLYRDMLVMVDQEKELRRKLADRGVVESEREAFELLPDDERQCRHCQALCFLSAVTCCCTPGKLVCLQHADQLCSCPPDKQCLRYRYTLDELPAMLLEVENKAQDFFAFERRIRTALNETGDGRLTVTGLKARVRQASESGFSSSLVNDMETAIAEAERCSIVANQLVNDRPRTRHNSSGHLISKKDMDDFVMQVEGLCCRIECRGLMKLWEAMNRLEQSAQDAIRTESCDVEMLTALLQEASTATIEITCLKKLEVCLEQAKWQEVARGLVSATPSLSSVQRHLYAMQQLAVRKNMEDLVSTLKHFQTAGVAFEERMEGMLQGRPSVESLEDAVRDAALMPVVVPSLPAVQSALKSARHWVKDASAFQRASEKQEVTTLDSLLVRAANLNAHVSQKVDLQRIQLNVQAWRLKLQVFLPDECPAKSNVLPLLYPRSDLAQLLDRCHKPVNVLQRRRNLSSSDEASLIFDLATAELQLIRKVRSRHLSSYYQDCKSLTPAVHGLYCHCNQPLSGCMLRCELCLNYYHRACLAPVEQVDRYGRMLCSGCKRSAKPHLSKVGDIFADLRNIPVLMPEAMALRVLLQRAILWQIQARFSLSAVLEIFRAGAPHIADGLGVVGLRPFHPSAEEMKKMMQVVSCSSGGTHSSLDFRKRSVETCLEPLGLRSLEPYALEDLERIEPPPLLNARVCAHLEELMLQGDLLAVRMEEIPYIWTVLKANNPQMNNIKVEPRSPRPLQPAKRQSGDLDYGETSPSQSRKKKRRKVEEDTSGSEGNGSDEASEDLCKAKRCKHPSKSCQEVEWIQCDDCNKWYHLICIDLPPKVAHSIDRFSCFRCHPNQGLIKL